MLIVHCSELTRCLISRNAYLDRSTYFCFAVERVSGRVGRLFGEVAAGAAGNGGGGRGAGVFRRCLQGGERQTDVRDTNTLCSTKAVAQRYPQPCAPDYWLQPVVSMLATTSSFCHARVGGRSRREFRVCLMFLESLPTASACCIYLQRFCLRLRCCEGCIDGRPSPLVLCEL